MFMEEPQKHPYTLVDSCKVYPIGLALDDSGDYALGQSAAELKTSRLTGFAEVDRAASLSLRDLTVENVEALPGGDRVVAGAAINQLLTSINQRAEQLSIDGSYVHPSLSGYHFRSQGEAHQYVETLRDLFAELLDNQVVIELNDEFVAFYQHAATEGIGIEAKRCVQSAKLLGAIIISARGQAHLDWSDVPLR